MIELIQQISKAKEDVFLINREISDVDIELVCNQDTHNIRRLYLYVNKITSEGVLYIPRADWSNLTILNLHNNMIGAKGCKYLTSASMKALEHLNLGNNSIGDEGILHISKGIWSKLKILELRWIKKTSIGVGRLLKGNWSNFNIIDISQSTISSTTNKLQGFQLLNLFLSAFNSIERLYISRFPCQNVTEGDGYDFKIKKLLQQKFVKTKLEM